MHAIKFSCTTFPLVLVSVFTKYLLLTILLYFILIFYQKNNVFYENLCSKFKHFDVTLFGLKGFTVATKICFSRWIAGSDISK